MADPLLPDDPRRAGTYELVGRLGEGGQGSVFLGRDQQGRDVAVKLLHSRLGSDAVARRRFMRELEVAERVSGFCTARVLDADMLGDRPYIVSEYVRGPSLIDVVRDEGPLDHGALMRLAIGTATALVAIHRAGVVHRDFKPPNVLIGPGGPRVIDFGIARALDASATASGALGTPAYMAPEQVAADDVGPAADMFAWGGTMVFAATGRRPFPAESIPALFNQVLNAEPDLSGVPEPLTDLVAACLAKDPAVRPTSSDLLYRLMSLVGAEPPADADPVERGAEVVAAPTVPAAPAPAHARTAEPPPADPRRSPWMLATIPVALVTLAVAVPVAFANFGPGGEKSGGDGPEKVRIGVMGPMTGPSSKYGVSAMAAARLAVEEHNAGNPRTRAELVPIDTKGDPATAEAAATRATGQDLVAVVGPMLTGESEKAIPVFERRGLPSVSPSVSDAKLPEKGWKYWHTMLPGAKERLNALNALMPSTWDPYGTDKLAVLVDDRPETRAATDMFTAGAQESRWRGRLRRISMSPPGDPRPEDFAEAVKRLKEGGKENPKGLWIPEAVVGAFYGGHFKTAGPLIKQARKEGFKEPFYLTEEAFDDRLIKLADGEAEGAALACSCVDVSRGTTGMPKEFLDFLRRYAKANGGARPGPYGPEAYDAAKGILYTIATGDTTPEKINGHLRTFDIQGVTQRIRFDAKGRLRGGTSYVYQVQNGKFVLLGPATTAKLR
ncbi:bifunctional serine/threonine-protein kinase/ABC transporter substrate-binding protein [Actinomadura rudentiformis]|uniref:ABC transporter substrate-binding protein n=1 Tax=Actinomadura rudentiformis TaxID=359158 RepID=A0A6H9YD70_9ACTN|nr:bifunctional serine/threonine-protein kinase/ABC transporter substrate-binding protein [Actinomadura rudentiformis]KAB2343246.1 ABC transporter substrate-binding protein [Actinomadura rudentiformis]